MSAHCMLNRPLGLRHSMVNYLIKLLKRTWTNLAVWGSFILFVTVEVEVVYVVYKCLGIW